MKNKLTLMMLTLVLAIAAMVACKNTRDGVEEDAEDARDAAADNVRGD